MASTGANPSFLASRSEGVFDSRAPQTGSRPSLRIFSIMKRTACCPSARPRWGSSVSTEMSQSVSEFGQTEQKEAAVPFTKTAATGAMFRACVISCRRPGGRWSSDLWPKDSDLEISRDSCASTRGLLVSKPELGLVGWPDQVYRALARPWRPRQRGRVRCSRSAQRTGVIEVTPSVERTMASRRPPDNGNDGESIVQQAGDWNPVSTEPPPVMSARPERSSPRTRIAAAWPVPARDDPRCVPTCPTCLPALPTPTCPTCPLPPAAR